MRGLRPLLAALLLLCLFSANAQQPIVIRFSHVVAPDTPKGQAAEKFRQLVLRFNDTVDGPGAVIYVDNFRQSN